METGHHIAGHIAFDLPLTVPASRACVSCARAKVKCVAGTGPGSKCHRCHRLAKVCEPTVPQVRTQSQKRKRDAKASGVSKSHVKMLEEKLDGLAALLKSKQDFGLSAKPPTLSPTTSSLPSVNLSDQDVIVSSVEPVEVNGSDHISPDLSCCKPLPLQFSSTFNGLESEPSVDEGNVLLEIFRNHKSSFFPFILVPKSMSAQELRQERPFLYLSILAITITDYSKQMEFGKLIVKQMFERIFVNGERNLDLLLGVITSAAWSYSHLFNLHRLTSLVGAAMVLVFDLGLLRNPPKEPKRSLFEEALHATSNMVKLRPTQSLEEKRALLGYVVLSSDTSLSFRRTDVLRFSPYIEECRQILAESEDHPNDKALAATVKLQAILDRIYQSPWHSKSDSHDISPPVVLVVNSIEEQLKQFQNDILPELEDNKIVLLHFYAVKIALYQVGLSRPSMPTAEKRDFKQLDLLYSCLKATRAFCDIFLNIPAQQYLSFSMLTWSHLRCAIVALQQLSVFEDPDWSKAYVQETLDFLWVLDQLVERLNKAVAEANFDENHIFARTAIKIGRAKEYCEVRMTAPSASTKSDGSEYPDPDFFNDIWFQDVFERFDYEFNTSMPDV